MSDKLPDKDTIWKFSNEIASYIKLKCECFGNFKPIFGIICGSGLGNIAEILDGDDENQNVKRVNISYEEIPHLLSSTVEGTLNNLVIGAINKIHIVCFQGRVHLHENVSSWKATLPIRAMKILGIETVFLTNCVLPLIKQLNSGDILLIKDHVNLINLSCFESSNVEDDRWGLPFTDMKFAYDLDLNLKAKASAKNLKIEKYVKEGVYVMILGPNYPTFAEELFFSNIGSSCYGFSLANETLVARQCRMRVCGLSFVTTDFEDPSSAIQKMQYKLERADSHVVVDSDDVLTSPKNKAEDIIHNQKSMDQESMLALSVDDGSRRIGQIIKEIITRIILSP